VDFRRDLSDFKGDVHVLKLNLLRGVAGDRGSGSWPGVGVEGAVSAPPICNTCCILIASGEELSAVTQDKTGRVRWNILKKMHTKRYIL
jgi:hypothetical protein